VAAKKEAPVDGTMKFEGTPEAMADAVGKVAKGVRKVAREFQEEHPNDGKPPEAPDINVLLTDAKNTIHLQRLEPLQAVNSETEEEEDLVQEFDLQGGTPLPTLKTLTGKRYGGRLWSFQVANSKGEVLGGAQFAINKAPKGFESDGEGGGGAAGSFAGFRNMGMAGMGGVAQQIPPGVDPRFPMGWPPPAGAGWPGSLHPAMDPRYQSMFEDPEKKVRDKLAELKLAKMEREDQREAQREREGDRESKGRLDAIERLVGDLKKHEDDEVRSLHEEIRDLEREVRTLQGELKELVHRAEREADKRASSFEKAIGELKAAVDRVKSEFDSAMHRMQADLARSEEGAKGSQFTTLFESMNTAQANMMNTLTSTLTGMIGDKQGRDPLSDTEKIIGIVTSLGGSLLGHGAGEKSNVEILAQTVNENVPHLVDLYKSKMAQGENVAKDAINKKIDEAFSKIGPDIRNMVKALVIDKAKTKPALPAKTSAPAKPTVQRQAPPPKLAEPQAEAPASEPVATPQAEDDMKSTTSELINEMLSILLREADPKFQPSEAEWVAFALAKMPKPILQKWATITDQREFGLMMAEYADAKLLGEVASLLNKDKSAAEWVTEQSKGMVEYLRSMAGAASPPPSAVAS